MRMEKYTGTTRKSGGRAVWTGRVNLSEAALDQPLQWRRPQRIFVNSMSDLFQDPVPVEFIRSVWDVMQRAHWHVFQILTKRPERMRDVLRCSDFPVLPHVWVGTSVESFDYLRRLDHLRATPGAVRFVSFEPLLASVGNPDLREIHWAIVGGESGPGARPILKEWVQEIHESCRRQDVAFFFKQWGGKRKKSAGRVYAGRTWDEYPETSMVCA
jgi:protein gp37